VPAAGRGIAAGLALAAVLAGCGGSVPPFFVVHNDESTRLSVTYCATQDCPHPHTTVLPAGNSGRFTNSTGPTGAGYVFVTVGAQRRSCTVIPPAATMVDKLFVFPISSFFANSCAGYNPARPLGVIPGSSPRSAG
jgi:hypothetical protein